MSGEGSIWDYATPVNIALGAAIAYLLKTLLAPAPAPQPAAKPAPIPKRYFTVKDLAEYDGTHEIAEHGGRKAIYLAVNGVVFDVSSGSMFYGPGGPYGVFAGRDASRGLATMQVAKPPIEWDNHDGLSKSERSTMMEWYEKFLFKYPIRGELVESIEAIQNPATRHPSYLGQYPFKSYEKAKSFDPAVTSPVFFGTDDKPY